jgi:hypothetical protein
LKSDKISALLETTPPSSPLLQLNHKSVCMYNYTCKNYL